jgi:uncharacterized protein YbcI
LPESVYFVPSPDGELRRAAAPEQTIGRPPESCGRAEGRQCDPSAEEVVATPDRDSKTEGPKDPGRPDDRREPPSASEVSEEISREILRIHEESYGKGAGQAHAFVGEDFVTVVLDDLELLPNEKFLVEHGDQETVLQVRSQYQRAIRASFSAAIERATGRSVIGFASTTSMGEPPFAAEIFRLA